MSQFVIEAEQARNTLGMPITIYVVKGPDGVTYAETRYRFVAELVQQGLPQIEEQLESFLAEMNAGKDTQIAGRPFQRLPKTDLGSGKIFKESGKIPDR